MASTLLPTRLTLPLALALLLCLAACSEEDPMPPTSDAGADMAAVDMGGVDMGADMAAPDMAATDMGMDLPPELCEVDERVQSHQCVACPAGEVNEAGDDASGADTSCEVPDACTRTLGLTCDQVLEGYLKASNSEGSDGFGSSVSLSGDRLAVGAPGEDSCADGVGGDQMNNGCEGAGAAYLLRLAP